MPKVLNRIKIDKIGYGGIGLARMSDGKRILIKGGGLPGSIVDLKIVKQKKDYIEAHIIKIIDLDDKIVDGEIFCPHFFSMLDKQISDTPYRKIGCGGCKRQMLSYANQLTLKENIVHDAFTKVKKKLPELQIASIIGSSQEKYYRNKIEFSFGKYIKKNKEGVHEILSNWSCGFHKQGEFSKIVHIDHCSLISEEANSIYHHITKLCKNSGLPVYDQITHQGFFRHLVIRQGINTHQFLVNLSVADNNLKTKNNKQWHRFLDTLQNDDFLKKKITTFVITYNNGLADVIKSKECDTKILWGEGYIHEILAFKHTSNNNKENIIGSETTNEQSSTIEITFRISPFSFFQTNTLGAQQLFSQAISMVGYFEGTILDIYCGTGSIGISFLKLGKGDKLVGIDIVEDAIVDAWHNAKINNINQKVIFLASSAEKAFLHNPEFKNNFDNLGLVIVDPPRDGLHKNVVQMICDLKREFDFKLLYISCNPISMVRDIELFVESGFNIKKIQPIDMFPQTHHIECIGVLT